MNAIIEPGFADAPTCRALIENYERARTDGKGFVYNQHNIGVADLDSLTQETGDRVQARLEAEFEVTLEVDTHYVTRLELGQSHVPHADCERREGNGWVPNHTAWRRFSAILYLSSGFAGGEFFFTDPPQEIRPEIGLLIGFPADRNFEHGVRTLRWGERYTMPMWFR